MPACGRLRPLRFPSIRYTTSCEVARRSSSKAVRDDTERQLSALHFRFTLEAQCFRMSTSLFSVEFSVELNGGLPGTYKPGEHVQAACRCRPGDSWLPSNFVAAPCEPCDARQVALVFLGSGKWKSGVACISYWPALCNLVTGFTRDLRARVVKRLVSALVQKSVVPPLRRRWRHWRP
jgi:hypothetical protein